MSDILIIDFGAGNINSLRNAVSKLVGKNNVSVVSEARDFSGASHIILPGVGAFDRVMSNLQGKEGMVTALEDAVQMKKIPFLGICVGMQILAEKGYENKILSGLGWIAGEVKPIVGENLIVPHMGWNTVKILDANIGGNDWVCRLDNKDFYFVHSFYFDCMKKENIVGQVSYGDDLSAIISNDNIIATQFHPEKSGDNGLEFLSGFLN